MVCPELTGPWTGPGHPPGEPGPDRMPGRAERDRPGRAQRFTAVRAGRTYRIPRADVLRWMVGLSPEITDSSPATPGLRAED